MLLAKLLGSPACQLVAGAVIAHMAPNIGIGWPDDTSDSTSYERLQDRIMLQRGQQKCSVTPTPALSMPPEQPPATPVAVVTEKKKRAPGCGVPVEIAAMEVVLHVERCKPVTQQHELDVAEYSIPSLELEELLEWFPLPKTRKHWQVPVETKRAPRAARRGHRFHTQP